MVTSTVASSSTTPYRFIEGYYLVGLLAKAILARNPGGKVVHDPRLVWNTVDMVEQAGGVPVQCKSGHAFIKKRCAPKTRCTAAR